MLQKLLVGAPVPLAACAHVLRALDGTATEVGRGAGDVFAVRAQEKVLLPRSRGRFPYRRQEATLEAGARAASLHGETRRLPTRPTAPGLSALPLPAPAARQRPPAA